MYPAVAADAATAATATPPASGPALSALDSQALAARLRALAGEERSVQANFLLHLAELDRRRGYAELGYASLWDYCLRALHLREGAAGRRIAAMRVLRRFPSLEAALREGRLCLSTMSLLGQVLTEANLAELTARAAFKTRAEVDAIVASVKPRATPAQGIRQVTVRGGWMGDPQPAPSLVPKVGLEALGAAWMVDPQPTPSLLPIVHNGRTAPSHAEPAVASGPPGPLTAEGAGRLCPVPAGCSRSNSPLPAAPTFEAPADRPFLLSTLSRPPELRALRADGWSLRVTLDLESKRALETLTALLGHKVPNGDLAAVLKEALRCAIEKHGKRRGLVHPDRARRPAPAKPALESPPLHRSAASAPEPPPAGPRAHSSTISASTIPAAVRREVWARDAGRCTFVAADGTRCDSRWKLELDHIHPKALGGPPTADNVRLRCKAHNMLHAEQVFGRRYMDRYRRPGELAFPSATASDSQ